MVGGGRDAFIGEVHRIAARMDDCYELLAGCLSATPAKAHESARRLGIPRSYDDFSRMAREEAAREDGIEAVAIVTPNHLHHPAAMAFLEAGIHVICDKPLTATVEQALALQKEVNANGRRFMVTYNYSGYPMARHARELVAGGALGGIRLVQVEYPQDWLATDLEKSGHKQASWRTDPAQAGAGGSLGDIGTHAFHLAEWVSGCRVESLLADLNSFVDGRLLDDNAHILLRFGNGAKGQLWASQVAAGHENGLRLRIYGDKAGLEWFQEQPNQLKFSPLGAAAQTISRAGPGTGAGGIRLPAGHPEGFLEGFANLYRDFAALLRGDSDDYGLLPTVAEGVRGVRFVEAAVASSSANGRWQEL